MRQGETGAATEKITAVQSLLCRKSVYGWITEEESAPRLSENEARALGAGGRSRRGQACGGMECLLGSRSPVPAGSYSNSKRHRVDSIVGKADQRRRKGKILYIDDMRGQDK
jgi:hypothetical protein